MVEVEGVVVVVPLPIRMELAALPIRLPLVVPQLARSIVPARAASERVTFFIVVSFTFCRFVDAKLVKNVGLDKRKCMKWGISMT